MFLAQVINSTLIQLFYRIFSTQQGEMEISPACYAHLTHMLMGVTGTIVVVLEGGYCLASLAESAALTLRTLLGDPVPPLRSFTPPSESYAILLNLYNIFKIDISLPIQTYISEYKKPY